MSNEPVPDPERKMYQVNWNFRVLPKQLFLLSEVISQYWDRVKPLV